MSITQGHSICENDLAIHSHSVYFLKFILYFSKKNKNTEMKKDKCNSRESWFLLFMPENHNFHPNFIEIPFINVSKDFLDTMTLTL